MDFIILLRNNNNKDKINSFQLSHMKSSDISKHICKACANQLCDISSFQKQVLKAEKLYKKYWDHIIGDF